VLAELADVQNTIIQPKIAAATIAPGGTEVVEVDFPYQMTVFVEEVDKAFHQNSGWNTHQVFHAVLPNLVFEQVLSVQSKGYFMFTHGVYEFLERTIVVAVRNRSCRLKGPVRMNSSVLYDLSPMVTIGNHKLCRITELIFKRSVNRQESAPQCRNAYLRVSNIGIPVQSFVQM